MLSIGYSKPKLDRVYPLIFSLGRVLTNWRGEHRLANVRFTPESGH